MNGQSGASVSRSERSRHEEVIRGKFASRVAELRAITDRAATIFHPSGSEFLSWDEDWSTETNNVASEDTNAFRNELAARLEAAEARSETRFVDLTAKIEAAANSIGTSIGRMESDLQAVRLEVQNVNAEVEDVKKDNKATRWTIVITVIGSVLAGLAALYTVQGSLLQAFQTGVSLYTTQPVVGSNSGEGDVQSAPAPGAESPPKDESSPSKPTGG